MIGDSIQLYTRPNTIKTFAKKDIVENMPMGERRFSVVTAPDSINVRRMIKLPNGSVLATIQNNIFSFVHQKYDINKNSITIFNDNEVKAYETIKYDSFDVTSATKPVIDANSLIKAAYADGHLGLKGNDLAVFSVSNQFILYTFGMKSGKVVKEKRYSKMERKETITINDMRLNVVLMNTNDKYILCVVEGYLSEKDKESGKIKNAIFVFDWDLNPIKKFYFEDEKIKYYTISNDCKSVYFGKSTDEGLIISKADLNI